MGITSAKLSPLMSAKDTVSPLALYNTELICITLQCTAPYTTNQYCPDMHCIFFTLLCSTLYFAVLVTVTFCCTAVLCQPLGRAIAGIRDSRKGDSALHPGASLNSTVCIALYCTALNCLTLHCTVLHYTSLHCSVVQCIVL